MMPAKTLNPTMSALLGMKCVNIRATVLHAPGAAVVKEDLK